MPSGNAPITAASCGLMWLPRACRRSYMRIDYQQCIKAHESEWRCIAASVPKNAVRTALRTKCADMNHTYELDANNCEAS
eukprot:3396-Heterococcus_DN1.PRE.1